MLLVAHKRFKNLRHDLRDAAWNSTVQLDASGMNIVTILMPISISSIVPRWLKVRIKRSLNVLPGKVRTASLVYMAGILLSADI